MKPTRSRLRWLAVFGAVVALIGAACSSSSNKTATNGSASSSESSNSASSPAACNTTSANIDYGSLSGTLNGSGSSFQDVFNQKAKAEFASVASNVTVNDAKSGSSAGKTDLQNQTVQFAGTDSLIKDS